MGARQQNLNRKNSKQQRQGDSKDRSSCIREHVPHSLSQDILARRQSRHDALCEIGTRFKNARLFFLKEIEVYILS